MKYSKKQIIKGFESWNAAQRLRPSNYYSDEEALKKDVDMAAIELAEELIKHINK